MRDYQQFNLPVQYLFCDIDDTLTTNGKLGAMAYSMLWKLAESGIQIIPVTGRPAGWCEMIARFWPVLGIIGENGAFAFSYQNRQMVRHYQIPEPQRQLHQQKLALIGREILATVPGAAISSDQFTRLFDLAIDFCEDVEPLPATEIDKIVAIFHRHGAIAKVSSIHVNGWFGEYDKRQMCELFFKRVFGRELANDQRDCCFIGDSPNDEPLFGFFANSFAVANINKFVDRLQQKPQYLVPRDSGEGFRLFAQHLLTLVGK